MDREAFQNKDWNVILNEALSELKSGDDSKFFDIISNIGLELSSSENSLLVSIDTSDLPEYLLKRIRDWGIEFNVGDNISFPLDLPKRETTGTHGSGERQKIMEAIKTISLDCEDDGSLVIINLYGLWGGLYHKLAHALTLRLPSKCINSIEVIPETRWKEMLTSSAKNVSESDRSKNWPDFVSDQVSDLLKNLK